MPEEISVDSVDCPNLPEAKIKVLKHRPLVHRRSSNSHAEHLKYENSTKAMSSNRLLPDTGLRVPRNPDARRTFHIFCRLFVGQAPPTFPIHSPPGSQSESMISLPLINRRAVSKLSSMPKITCIPSRRRTIATPPGSPRLSH
ncbi:hypothetical protein TNCV_3756191 [Trichonephila clavipes]|nr:hypothetical protein TNCV_3756191 [Trichonephila clavipes]